MKRKIMRKKLSILMIAIIVLAGFGLASAPAAENSAQASSAAEPLAVAVIDPVKVERGERNTSNPALDRVLVVNRPNASAIAGDVIVYTGRNYDMDTTVRPGAVEYAVEIMGESHIVRQKFQPMTDTGNEIPVPGYILSIPAAMSGTVNYQVNDQLSLTGIGDMPIVKETVDNLTKRVRVEIHNLNAASNTYAGSVYYSDEYGATTEQNQYNREIGFAMITEGSDAGLFTAVAFKQLLSADYNKNFPIPNPGFALIASNVEDYEDNYIHSVVSMLNEGTAFGMGDLVRLSGRQYFDFDYEVSHYYDYIDPGSENIAGKGFPENRGAEQMMIYTKSVADGSATLKTNEYGYEAAVNSNGEIERIAVNVVDIPEGGFVVSAQGLLRDWARTYFKRGASVIINETNKTFTIKNTITTMRSETQIDIDNYDKQIKGYIAGMYDLDYEVLQDLYADFKETGEEIIDIIDGIQGAGEMSAEEYTARMLSLKNKRAEFDSQKILINTASVESRVVDGRGLWHVPNIDGTETSLEGIKAVIKTFVDYGLNTVIVEGYYAGYSHAASNVVPQNPDSAQYTYGEYGNDYFKAFYTEAKKAGLEVHVAMTVYYMGRTDKWAARPDRLATLHPDWINTNEKGLSATHDGHHAVFGDPANPAYRKMLTDYVTELFTAYPAINGLNLDYIRYPDAAGGRDFGYTRYGIQGFLQTYGYTFRGDDNNNIESLRTDFHKFVNGSQAIRTQWNNYRIGLVTQTVIDIKAAMKAASPGALVSIATGPSADSAKSALKQDWGSWVRSGLIDMCTPMAYFTDAGTVQRISEKGISVINNLAYNYVGIGPYLKFSASDYVNQMEAAHLSGSMGYMMFSSEQFLKQSDARELVLRTVNKKAAITAHSPISDILRVTFDDILQKAQTKYIPADNMTQSQYEALSAEFDRIKALPSSNAKEFYAIYNAVDKVRQSVRTYTSFYAQDRLKSDIELLLGNINIKINRALIDSGEWNPSLSAARPTLTDVSAIIPDKITRTVSVPKEENTGALVGAVSGGTALCVAIAGAYTVLIRKLKSVKTK